MARWKTGLKIVTFITITAVVLMSFSGCGSKNSEKDKTTADINVEYSRDNSGVKEEQKEGTSSEKAGAEEPKANNVLTKSNSEQKTDETTAETEADITSTKVKAGYANDCEPVLRQDLPNGEKYDNTYFESYGTNPFVTVEEEPKSTFAVDVDTASYTIFRNYINNAALPPKESVRVEEFVNYFDRKYPYPTRDAFSVYTEIAPSIFGEGYHMVEIGLQGKQVDAEERKDASLTFVIDVSGSMNRENRLELVKRSLELLVEQMEERDKIGIAVYGTQGRILLKHTSGENKRQIIKAINSLKPEGSTNAEEGLTIGYEMASRELIKDGVNRVILCSDGVANTGETQAEAILRMVEDYRYDGVTLTALGFGMGNYNDVLMEKLADKGDGSYAYIDNISEARKVFLEQLTGTLQVIAKDVKTQVEFNPDAVDRYRLLGYENRLLEEEDFRDDSVDAGEVGAGHSVTALYEIKLKDNFEGDIGTIRLRYKDPETGKTHEIKKEMSKSKLRNSFFNATPRFKFLCMVAETAEILKNSFWAKNNNLENVLEMVESEIVYLESSEADQEFVDLLEKAVYMNEQTRRN